VSGLDDAFALVAGRFFQREVRARAEDSLAGMVSDLAGVAAGNGSGAHQILIREITESA
jgi:hypothetical protein